MTWHIQSAKGTLLTSHDTRAEAESALAAFRRGAAQGSIVVEVPPDWRA